MLQKFKNKLIHLGEENRLTLFPIDVNIKSFINISLEFILPNCLADMPRYNIIQPK